MKNSDSTTKQGRSAARRERRVFVFLLACIGFNFALAMVNAATGLVNSTQVIVVQLILTAIAAIFVVTRRAKMPLAMVWGIAITFCSYVTVCMYRGEPDLKSLYEMVTAPIFFLLGTTLTRFPLGPYRKLFYVVIAFAIFELLLPSAYAGLVNPLSYYRNTRAWAASGGEAISGEAGLYQGAMRAGGTFFSFLGDHRAGSVFLEPLSLGYFAFISSIIFSVLYRKSFKTKLIMVGGCLAMSLMADSRIPTVLITISFLLSLVPRFPTWLAYCAAPLGFLAANFFYAVSASVLLLGGDLTYRLSLTFEGLYRADLPTLLFGNVIAAQVEDSGFLYLIYHFGLIGTLAFIANILGLLGYSWKGREYIPIAFSLYVVGSSMFGGAMLSIKTLVLFAVAMGYFATHAQDGVRTRAALKSDP